jgi:hypothetical protein
MAFSFSYPTQPYFFSTNSIVDISCIFVGDQPADTRFVLVKPLPRPLQFNPDNGNVFGTTNLSSISPLTTYTVNLVRTNDPTIIEASSNSLSMSIEFLPKFLYPPTPTIFPINEYLVIQPVYFITNIPDITYTLITPSSSALTDIGLSLNSTTGVINGIPNKASPLTTYTVQSNNLGLTYDATVEINIQAIPIVSYPQSIYTLTQNQAVSILPINNNQTDVVYSISCILPFGLSLNTTTGEISGSPRILSTFTIYSVTIANSIVSTSTKISLNVVKVVLAPPVVGDYFSSNTLISNPAVAMRRKAEIFKYKKNSSNLTKQQNYALLAKGNGPYAKRAWGTQGDAYTNPNTSNLPQVGNAIICNTGIICAPTSSSDVPGPIMNLCYNPAVGLAGYNAPNRKKVDIGFRWPYYSWKLGDNGFPNGKAGSG